MTTNTLDGNEIMDFGISKDQGKSDGQILVENILNHAQIKKVYNHRTQTTEFFYETILRRPNEPSWDVIVKGEIKDDLDQRIKDGTIDLSKEIFVLGNQHTQNNGRKSFRVKKIYNA